MTTQAQNKPKRYGSGVIISGILIILVLITIPLFIIKDSEFSGSDGVGSDTISTIAPDYDSSWTTNWWTPSRETESALFALQATVGGILIGYVFGYLRGRKKTELTRRRDDE